MTMSNLLISFSFLDCIDRVEAASLLVSWGQFLSFCFAGFLFVVLYITYSGAEMQRKSKKCVLRQELGGIKKERKAGFSKKDGSGFGVRYDIGIPKGSTMKPPRVH